jgi:hypothetical protein
LISGSSFRPRFTNDNAPATTERIIRKIISERFDSAHLERFGPIMARESRAGEPSAQDAAPARRR